MTLLVSLALCTLRLRQVSGLVADGVVHLCMLPTGHWPGALPRLRALPSSHLEVGLLVSEHMEP